jgi:hypothetical protein
MYQYMIERWGERAPLDLMDRYAEGQREADAMKAVLGVSQSEFLEQFKGWAEGQLASWGLGRREGEPSLARILLEEAAADEKLRSGLEEGFAGALDEAAWSASGGGGAEPEWKVSVPKPEKAIADRWLERYPDHPDLLEAEVRYALIAADQKPAPDMVPLLERYAAARPVDPLPHQMLARIYLAAREGETVEGKGPEGAIPHLEWLDAREQNSPSYAAELARRYAALEDWPKAEAKAERAATIAPFDADERELAATIALRHGAYDVALRHLTALTIIEPAVQKHRQRLEALQRMMESQPRR